MLATSTRRPPRQGATAEGVGAMPPADCATTWELGREGPEHVMLGWASCPEAGR